jgi:hypothetical protein
MSAGGAFEKMEAQTASFPGTDWTYRGQIIYLGGIVNESKLSNTYLQMEVEKILL